MIIHSAAQPSHDWAKTNKKESQSEPNNWLQRIKLWWAEFSLQTKLLAITTVVVSLIMTSITFFTLNGIQRDAGMNDTRYARDLGLLLSGNVTELVAKKRDKKLVVLTAGWLGRARLIDNVSVDLNKKIVDKDKMEN